MCISENLGAICDKENLILLLKEQKIEFLMYKMLTNINNFQLKWLKESCKSHHSFPILDCRGKNIHLNRSTLSLLNSYQIPSDPLFRKLHDRRLEEEKALNSTQNNCER